MSNKTNSDGFEWDELWAAFEGQPDFIQRAWFAELSKPENLPKAMKQSERYKNEIFDNAPMWIKKFFGYIKTESDSTNKDKNAIIYMLKRI